MNTAHNATFPAQELAIGPKRAGESRDHGVLPAPAASMPQRTLTLVRDVSHRSEAVSTPSPARVLSTEPPNATTPTEGDSNRILLLEYALDRIAEPGSGGLIIFDSNGTLVKADARAMRVLAQMNIKLQPGLPIKGLVTCGTQCGTTTRLPHWLRTEWLHPVFKGAEQIGTVAILPARVQSCSSRGALPGHKLRRVREFIDAHMSLAIRLEQLAAAAALSPYHFHRQFKNATGLTPREYVVRVRIEHAKALLTESDLPLVDVAGQAGFMDQSHFTTMFRKLTSMTPREFRNLASV
jgi:AraC-like DNA-binding protein